MIDEQLDFATISDSDADDLLENIKALEDGVKAAEDKRDALIAHYLAKIERAKIICDDETKSARAEIERLTLCLKEYATVHVTDKKRSVKLPTGTLSFRKQSPRFFFDDLREASARDEQLIHFVKHNAYDYLKVKTEEYVDWEHFKRKLNFSEGGTDVYYADTGEIIDGLHAQILPDKFTVRTND